jgi:hypothetical protein
MKAELNEQSLPLVNMTVDVTALNKTDFVPGEIEITDYYRRTDPESETVRYPCKYRIRGGISTAYEKKSFAPKNWYSKNHAYLCAEFKSDITTSIEETARQQTAVAHTLVGHRVDVRSMQKGIYIIDGKKVAVR